MDKSASSSFREILVGGIGIPGTHHMISQGAAWDSRNSGDAYHNSSRINLKKGLNPSNSQERS